MTENIEVSMQNSIRIKDTVLKSYEDFMNEQVRE